MEFPGTSTFDWTGFDNRYRGWGRDGSAFPNTDNQFRWTSGTGRIWDWSLNQSDTVLRNSVTIPINGDETITHTWTADSASNCSSLDDAAVWDGSSCSSTFLRNAMEIEGDGIGNDNSLCESGEDCIVLHNLGSYQGHGALALVSPAFVESTSGGLTGITLYEYTTNGY